MFSNKNYNSKSQSINKYKIIVVAVDYNIKLIKVV